MSTYARMSGQVTCPDEQDYDKLVGHLQAQGWVDDEGFFLDEAGERIDEEKGRCLRDALEINIPDFHHRNLVYVEFFRNPLRRGRIVGTCVDGCFEGFEVFPGGSRSASLRMFADGPEPDPEGDFSVYCAWQERASARFLEAASWEA